MLANVLSYTLRLTFYHGKLCRYSFVDIDNSSVTEVGSSLAAERMTRSRARRNREERAARSEANTLARRNARGRQSQGERTATETCAQRSHVTIPGMF